MFARQRHAKCPPENRWCESRKGVGNLPFVVTHSLYRSASAPRLSGSRTVSKDHRPCEQNGGGHYRTISQHSGKPCPPPQHGACSEPISFKVFRREPLSKQISREAEDAPELLLLRFFLAPGIPGGKPRVPAPRHSQPSAIVTHRTCQRTGQCRAGRAPTGKARRVALTEHIRCLVLGNQSPFKNLLVMKFTARMLLY